MKINMGITDRVLRLLAALIIAVFYLTGNISGSAAVILCVFAILFTVTSLTGICPLYYPLKIKTMRKKN